MRIAIIGQQDFGKATMEAFLNRGDEVAAVFCAPEKGRPDPLRVAAETARRHRAPVPQADRPGGAGGDARRQRPRSASWPTSPSSCRRISCNIPKFGTIQFHPSLLPLHRGASSMSWSIILRPHGDRLQHFPPDRRAGRRPGDPDPRRCRSRPRTRWARCISARSSRWASPAWWRSPTWWSPARRRRSRSTNRTPATRASSATPNRTSTGPTHVDITYNLIRGCNPAPGAWTTLDGKKLFLFDARKRIARTFSEVKGKKLGEVVALNGSGALIHGQGGFIEVQRVRWDGGQEGRRGRGWIRGRHDPRRIGAR